MQNREAELSPGSWCTTPSSARTTAATKMFSHTPDALGTVEKPTGKGRGKIFELGLEGCVGVLWKKRAQGIAGT